MISLQTMAQNSRTTANIRGKNRPIVNSMKVADTHTTDTLRLIDRIALRTNALDWFLLIPNIGVEFDVKPLNWNRWTVGVSFRGNWETSHTYKPATVYNLREVRAEGRQYWRTRDMGYEVNDSGKATYRKLDPHEKIWDKAFSIRRKTPRYPNFTWFRGIYASYMDYSLKLFSTGRQGSAISLGATWGFIQNLYAFQNGNSLDLELGVSGGFMYTKDTEYTHDAESDCYPVQRIKQWHLVPFPVINDIHVTLVYRLGRYPSAWKYRYRDDVELQYGEDKRTLRISTETARNQRLSDKQMYDSISHEFWTIYDTEVKKHQQQRYQQHEQNLLQQQQQQSEPQPAEEQPAGRKDEEGKEGRDE
jgi:hypothetical protein